MNFQNAEGSQKKTCLSIDKCLRKKERKNLLEEIVSPKDKKFVKGKQSVVGVLNEHFANIDHATSLEASTRSYLIQLLLPCRLHQIVFFFLTPVPAEEILQVTATEEWVVGRYGWLIDKTIQTDNARCYIIFSSYYQFMFFRWTFPNLLKVCTCFSTT